MTETELYHAGVKGMKWGVRKDEYGSTGGKRKTGRTTNDTLSTKVKKTKNTTTIKARKGDERAKLTVKKNRGAKVVAKNNNAKVKVIVANTANVTAGALRVAAAFIPGMSVLSGVANVAALTGTVATLKK